jgi:hypothetical protein
MYWLIVFFKQMISIVIKHNLMINYRIMQNKK